MEEQIYRVQFSERLHWDVWVKAPSKEEAMKIGRVTLENHDPDAEPATWPPKVGQFSVESNGTDFDDCYIEGDPFVLEGLKF